MHRSIFQAEVSAAKRAIAPPRGAYTNVITLKSFICVELLLDRPRVYLYKVSPSFYA